MAGTSNLLDEAKENFRLLKEVDVDKAELGVFLVAASRSKEGWTRRRMPLSRPLMHGFRETIKGLVTQLGDRATVFKEFEIDRKLDDHEVEVIDLTAPEFSSIREELDALKGEEPGVSLSRDEIKKLASRFKYHAIRVSLGGNNNAYLISHYTRSRALIPDNGFSVVFNRDGLKEIDDPVLNFDDIVHGVVINDSLIVLNQNSLFRAFGYFEAVVRMAHDGLTKIIQTIKVDRIEELEAMIATSHPMRLRLVRIGNSPYLEGLTTEQIQKVLDDFPEVKITIKLNGSGEEYLCWIDATAWELVSLIGDDLLSSPMTEMRYSVNSKSSLEG